MSRPYQKRAVGLEGPSVREPQRGKGRGDILRAQADDELENEIYLQVASWEKPLADYVTLWLTKSSADMSPFGFLIFASLLYFCFGITVGGVMMREAFSGYIKLWVGIGIVLGSAAVGYIAGTIAFGYYYPSSSPLTVYLTEVEALKALYPALDGPPSASSFRAYFIEMKARSWLVVIYYIPAVAAVLGIGSFLVSCVARWAWKAGRLLLRRRSASA